MPRMGRRGGMGGRPGMGRPGMRRPVARQGMRRRRRVRRRRMLLVGGLVAYGTYKMTTKDAKRIEQHTGVNPEEMTDAELEKAMSDLHIEKQTRTAADTEIGTAPGSPAKSAGSDYLTEIQQLAELRDAGVLTDAEFTAKKAQILGLN